MADRPTIFLLVTILVLVTTVLISAMKHFSVARQARLSNANENAYRELAETTVAAQTEIAKTISTLQASIADINKRVTGIEKLLKDVG